MPDRRVASADGLRGNLATSADRARRSGNLRARKKGERLSPIALERHHEGVGGNPPLGGRLLGEEGINLRAVLPCFSDDAVIEKFKRFVKIFAI